MTMHIPEVVFPRQVVQEETLVEYVARLRKEGKLLTSDPVKREA